MAAADFPSSTGFLGGLLFRTALSATVVASLSIITVQAVVQTDILLSGWSTTLPKPHPLDRLDLVGDWLHDEGRATSSMLTLDEDGRFTLDRAPESVITGETVDDWTREAMWERTVGPVTGTWETRPSGNIRLAMRGERGTTLEFVAYGDEVYFQAHTPTAADERGETCFFFGRSAESTPDSCVVPEER